MSTRKKAVALSMNFIVSIAILTLALVLILGIWGKVIKKAEPATAESLCESFNAARALSTIKIGPERIRFVPNACKTIHKTESENSALPESGYPQTTKGIQENIRRLSTKCWKMWLEAREPLIFGSPELTSATSIAASTWFDKGRCFICYTFTIKESKDIQPFTSETLDTSFDENIFFAEDVSDKCDLTSLGYGGGVCMTECGVEPYPLLTREENPKKCKEEGKPKCCVAEDEKDECINKGGDCKFACDPGEKEYSLPSGWQCADKDKICCVKEKNVYSYRDYFQYYQGSGRVAIEPGLVFEPEKETYAITYVSDVSGSIWDNPGIKRYFTVGPEIATLLITRLDTVSDYCNQQIGATGD